MDIICFIFDKLKDLVYLSFYCPSLTQLAQLATVAGAIGIFVGIKTLQNQNLEIQNQNLEKRMEVIKRIYDAFGEGDLFEFYGRIRHKDSTIDWNGEKDEKLLNRSLTVFDEINYLQTQKPFDDKVWEYIASEIQYFAFRKDVWDYMVKRIQEGLDNGFPTEIIPFTGFPELLGNIPVKFRAKLFPWIPKEHREFYKKLDESKS